MPWPRRRLRTTLPELNFTQQLAGLRGIGVQSATALVREVFVRRFANGKALGEYAGLTATPDSSGGRDASRA